MVLLLRPPAGEEYKMHRKMVWFLIWFLVSGLIEDSHFASAATENHHTLQKASNDNHEVQKNSSTSNKNPEASLNNADSQLESDRKIRAVPPRVKSPNKVSYSGNAVNDEILGYIRKIPIHIVEFQQIKVPTLGRSNGFEEDTEHLALFDIRKRDEDGKKRNTVIPMPRLGRSYNEDSETLEVESFEDAHILSKRSNTIIPIARPERGSNKIKRGTSTSVIPYPRLGQFSTRYSDEDLTESEAKPNFLDIANEFADAEYDDLDLNNSVQKREVQVEHDTVIPYPRPGRSDSENNIYTQIKRQNTEFVVPQIRYGRSMLLLSTTKNGKSANDKPPTFVLPYPRPGRSNNEQIKEISFENEKKRQDYMPPTARLGRTALNTRFEDDNILDIEDAFLGLKVNPLFLKSLSERTKDLGDSGSSFVIPYPRPGKKSTLKIQNPNKVVKFSNTDNKKLSDYVLPYPRPGKKFSNEPSLRKFKNINNEKENSEKQNFILPYPRPGRSYYDWFGKENTQGKYQNEDYKIFEDRYQDSDEHLGNSIDTSDSEMDITKQEDSSSGFRFKRSNTVIPYPRLGRSNFVVPYPRFGRSSTVVPYPRLGRSNSVVPYARLGRSNSVVPYPRPGRSNSVIPYPRPGRSNSVIPYPRIGRSNSVIPYPRIGRSNLVIPYPRLGRSNSVVPYPRLGRSDSVVPYPRLGRSDTVVPYPRLGRSDTVVPYPRLGRSDTVVPYPRLGRSNSVIPYPRIGRSESVIPYPRPGRSNFYKSVESVDGSYYVIPSASNTDFSNLRLRKSDYITPYPRPGRSQDDKLFSVNNREIGLLPPDLSHERDYSKRQDTYIVPYPRPGRFIEKKGSENNMVIPYPRPGRSNKIGSGYVLPQPRVARSEYIAFNDNETPMDGRVIPLPPVERSQQDTPPHPSESFHKVNKHMITNAEDSIYILPYPRPGRYSE